MKSSVIRSLVRSSSLVVFGDSWAARARAFSSARLLTIRHVVLVEGQPLLALPPVLVARIQGVGLLLVRDGLGEVARLGEGGGQRVEAVGVLPPAQLARPGRRRDAPLAVAILRL